MTGTEGAPRVQATRARGGFPREAGVLAVLLVECGILAVAAPPFRDLGNLTDVLLAMSFVATMAVGQAAVIISGGVDLSVGSVMGLSGVLAATAMTHGIPVPLAVALGLAAGALCGLTNGLLVAGVRLPPFIATLGMLSVARGLAYAITGGQTVEDLPRSFVEGVGQSHLGGVPVPALIMLATAGVGSLFLGRTVWGRRAYALGGNEEAARLSGVATGRLKVLLYTLSGCTAAIAAVLYVAHFTVAQSVAGLGYELDVVAAVVIGGGSLSGGEGSIPGAILGAAIMGVLRNGLVLLRVPGHWHQVAIGLVILLAVAADTLTRRK